MYFWTFALFATAKSAFNGSCLSVILLPFTLMSVTAKPETDDGWICVGDFHVARSDPSEISVAPILTLSTQKPTGFVPSAPRVAGSLYVRNARSTLPLYPARLHVSLFHAAE